MDLGCGHGNEIKGILQSKRAKKIIGLDISEKVLATAKENLQKYLNRGITELIRFDASKVLPFPSRTFDAVYSLDLFGHMISLALAETVKVPKSAISKFLGDLKYQAKENRYFYSVNRYVVIAYK